MTLGSGIRIPPGSSSRQVPCQTLELIIVPALVSARKTHRPLFGGWLQKGKVRTCLFNAFSQRPIEFELRTLETQPWTINLLPFICEHGEFLHSSRIVGERGARDPLSPRTGHGTAVTFIGPLQLASPTTIALPQGVESNKIPCLGIVSRETEQLLVPGWNLINHLRARPSLVIDHDRSDRILLCTYMHIISFHPTGACKRR